MLGIVAAVAGAVLYGMADFTGGAASRRTHVLRVVAVSAPASLVVELLVWPVYGAHWSVAALAWGTASGLASAAAFALLYASLAIGPMSVLSPVGALVSAALPVLVGVGLGESLTPLRVGGGLLGLVAIVLAGVRREGRRLERVNARGLVMAVGAGAAIATQLVCLDQAPDGSGVAPLLSGRFVSSAILLGAVALSRRRVAGSRWVLVPAAAAGVLDSLANLAFLVSSRHAPLSVAAVIVALYPAVTVVLAAVVLKERPQRLQVAALLAALLAIVALSWQ